MNKLFFSPTYCNFAHYNQLQTATSKLQSVMTSPLTSKRHDRVLVPLSGRLKQLFQSSTFRPMLLLRIFALLFISTLFTASNSRLLAQTDTFVCENGGFEDDFDFYFGWRTDYFYGSNTCSPVTLLYDPVFWSTITLPSTRQFEIVGPGSDPLIGIDMVKFGDKALRINHHYGAGAGDICEGHHHVNRIAKRFLVTEENRNFSVWFAAILENPTGHGDSQPFFSIHCDLAPEYDLCIDAGIIDCESEREDENCEFDPLDTIDWACHRIVIPSEYVGYIATLEITAADCGEGCHFGYAYIDGICEDCDGSVFGSAFLHDQAIDVEGHGNIYASCDGDTVRICGSYELPPVCGSWVLDTILIPEFTTYNLEVDIINQTFCFDIAIDEFSEETCRNVYAVLYFESALTSDPLPLVTTNFIEICEEDFITYSVDELTSSCNNNGTADFLSDDYYFVTVYVDYTFGKNWTMHRLKGDPPTGESGYYKVKQGSGDGTIVIGPFFIQEGNWDLIVTIDGCEHILPIVPPDFCGECANFHKTRITNVECEENDPEDPSDDTWSFYLGVYKQGMMTQYSLTHPNTSVTYHNFNMSHPVNAGLISNGCLEYTLNAGPGCMTKFIVCPPRPCSSESECEIEAYIEEYLCREDQTFVQFDVSGGLYLCYQIATIGGALSSPAAFTNPLGHFTQDVIIKFSVCSTAVCTCAVPECFVYVYVPFIEQDCPSLVSNEYETKRDKDNSLIIFPNPLEKQQLRLKSPYPKTEISIYNLSDQLFYQGEFEGQDHSLNLDLKQGVYLVKYRSSTGEQGFIKFIKF